jgi:uncharacterized protein DUF3540
LPYRRAISPSPRPTVESSCGPASTSASTPPATWSTTPAAASQVRIEPATTTVKATKLNVEANQARLVSAKIAVIAGHIASTAEEIAQNVGRYELTANRLIERTQCSFRDVKDLAQSRIGRVRTVVNDVYAVYSRRAVLVSKEETSIDGSKVLLG